MLSYAAFYWIGAIVSSDEERTKRDHVYIAKEARREVAKRLSQLKRYDAGTADDGGGYMYDYADQSKTGRWVEWDDIQKLIDELDA